MMRAASSRRRLTGTFSSGNGGGMADMPKSRTDPFPFMVQISAFRQPYIFQE
jgi:hypothetical protein